MIKELESYAIKDQYGTVYGKSIPSNIELMEKINEIIRYLNEKDSHEKDDSDIEADTELKNLYYNKAIPSWKPSEEQMKALQWWSELPSCSPGLKSLYEDLKKLM